MMKSRISAFLLLSALHQCEAFVSPLKSVELSLHHPSTKLHASSRQQSNPLENAVKSSILAASLAVAVSNPLPAQAYLSSDYASETIQEVVKTLKDASGNIDETFKAYETIADIITEGKGVGGMVNYQGIQLERGYIADEDTSIYNPGLTLLTESEKERLVEAVVDSRKVGLAKGQWSADNESAYQTLKFSLDPLHMAELSGFLGFVPFYGAIVYLGVLAVQQFARNLFPVAYGLGVVAFFGPILALIAAGP